MPECYYHATSATKWQAIQASGGFLAGSYFAIESIAHYYADVRLEEGEEVILITIPAHHFTPEHQGVDHPGIAEPVCYGALGKRESEVHDEWAESAKDVAACLSIIGSFQYLSPLCLHQSMKTTPFY